MSLVEKYERLDKLVHKKNQDETLDKLFSDILKETFELVNKKIEENKTLNVEDEEEKAAVRAMFEYMLELWEEEAFEEAKAIGYDMVYLIEDENLKEMFSMFVLGMLAGLDIDEFFEKYVNNEKVYKDMFFVDFDDSIEELIIRYKDKFKEEFSA